MGVLLIVGILVTGLFVGALGRLVIPGPNPMSITRTILVGIGGALLGGIVGSALFDTTGGLLLAVPSAALIVWWLDRAHRGDPRYP